MQLEYIWESFFQKVSVGGKLAKSLHAEVFLTFSSHLNADLAVYMSLCSPITDH